VLGRKIILQVLLLLLLVGKGCLLFLLGLVCRIQVVWCRLGLIVGELSLLWLVGKLLGLGGELRWLLCVALFCQGWRRVGLL